MKCNFCVDFDILVSVRTFVLVLIVLRTYLLLFTRNVLRLQEDQGIYQSKVRDMISDNRFRLIVNVNDLRKKNEDRANL